MTLLKAEEWKAAQRFPANDIKELRKKVVDEFGAVYFFKSPNVVILASKPGSKAYLVRNPWQLWPVGGRLAPIAYRISELVERNVAANTQKTWGDFLRQLGNVNSKQLDYDGPVTWSDFSFFDSLKLAHGP